MKLIILETGFPTSRAEAFRVFGIRKCGDLRHT
jgi:hypothetical protein